MTKYDMICLPKAFIPEVLMALYYYLGIIIVKLITFALTFYTWFCNASIISRGLVKVWLCISPIMIL